VLPETAVGQLRGGATIEQTFVARCSPLSEIDVWLETKAEPLATVQVEISDYETGTVLARLALESRTIATRKAQVEGTVERVKSALKSATGVLDEKTIRGLATLPARQALYFPQIRDAEGRRYVVRIRASDGADRNPVIVYGSAGDSYGDGSARRNGEPLAGDLAFTYGCTNP
jgi:hypothetical protein